MTFQIGHNGRNALYLGVIHLFLLVLFVSNCSAKNVFSSQFNPQSQNKLNFNESQDLDLDFVFLESEEIEISEDDSTDLYTHVLFDSYGGNAYQLNYLSHFTLNFKAKHTFHLYDLFCQWKIALKHLLFL